MKSYRVILRDPRRWKTGDNKKKTMTENKRPVPVDGLCRPNDVTLKYLMTCRCSVQSRLTRRLLLFLYSGRTVLRIDDLMPRRLLVYYYYYALLLFHSHGHETVLHTVLFVCYDDDIDVYIVLTRSIDRGVDVSIVIIASCVLEPR